MFEHFAREAAMESVLIDAAVVPAHSGAGVRGDQGEQTIGRSKGGFTSKTQAAALGNPSRFILIGGQHHEVTPAEALLEGSAKCQHSLKT